MKELKITQEGLAERLGVTQGAVAHWLSGRREPDLDTLGRLLDALGLPPLQIGPGANPATAYGDHDAKPDSAAIAIGSLEENALLDALDAMTDIQVRLLSGKLSNGQVSMLIDLRAAISEAGGRRKGKVETSNVVPIQSKTGADADTFNPDEHDLIRQSTAKIAAGHGEQNTHVDIDRELAFKKTWIKRKRLNPAALIVAYASGSSMSPSIEDGDAVLIDTATKELKNGKVFAFKDGDREDIIKRAVKEKGVWLLRSDNPDKSIPEHQDMPFVDEEGQQRFEIVGMAHWRGGDL